MKKQVKPVLVVLSNNYISKGSIFCDKRDGKPYVANDSFGSSMEAFCDAQNLLILDESAEIKDSDECYHEKYGICKFDSKYAKSGSSQPAKEAGFNKIIASHPTIQGTLPISKSFLEEFVKSPDAKVYANYPDYTEYISSPIGRIELPKKPNVDMDKNIVLTLENEEVKEEVRKPTLVERFADNGGHSHWDLIDSNGEILWTEDMESITRVEVICKGKGREYVNMNTGGSEVSYQDGGRTLKIFVQKH